MTPQADDLLSQAMSLPVEAREYLAMRLMDSVAPADEEAAEIHQAWLEEVKNRAAAADRGESIGIPIEEAWPRLAGEPWNPKPHEDA